MADTDTLALDARTIAGAIESWVWRRGSVRLCLTMERLAAQIMDYVWLRQSTHTTDIAVPTHPLRIPRGWTPEHEAVWRDWIVDTFPLDDWLETIMDPVFGTDERSWEVRCPGWRSELLEFLLVWIQRDLGRLAEVDRRPLPDGEQDEVDPRTARVDPYLMEHGRRGRRIKGGAQRDD